MTTPACDVEVIKIGGSLLAADGGRERIAEWLAHNANASVARVLIGGGGPPVDGLRQLDAAIGPAETWAHWAAIDAMDANTTLLADALPAVRLTESLDAIARYPRPRDWALRVTPWLRREEPACDGPRLRIGWATTSDAIAARVAVAFGPPTSLTLLKHRSEGICDSPEAIEALATKGVIDRESPRIAQTLGRLRIACLTAADGG